MRGLPEEPPASLCREQDDLRPHAPGAGQPHLLRGAAPLPDAAGSGRARKNIYFLIKINKKTIDFERRGGRGAAGLGKTSIFLLKSLRKLSILNAGAAGERPGPEKH